MDLGARIVLLLSIVAVVALTLQLSKQKHDGQHHVVNAALPSDHCRLCPSSSLSRDTLPTPAPPAESSGEYKAKESQSTAPTCPPCQCGATPQIDCATYASRCPAANSAPSKDADKRATSPGCERFWSSSGANVWSIASQHAPRDESASRFETPKVRFGSLNNECPSGGGEPLRWQPDVSDEQCFGVELAREVCSSPARSSFE